jgi:hypothetical protein
MATARQVEEIISRCVSAMVFYNLCDRSRDVDRRMIAEVRLIAGWAKKLGFGRGDVVEQIIRPVEVQLIARYGHELGPRLVAQLVDIFEGRANPEGTSDVSS